MRKVPRTLVDAKARENDILEKLGRVQQAAQGHKQQLKANQQKLEWIEQARKLGAESRKLQTSVEDAAIELGLACSLADIRQEGGDFTADVWFQVAGLRKLLRQVQQRNLERLRRAPDQAVEFRDLLGGVSAALGCFGERLTEEASALEGECAAMRRSLRDEIGADLSLHSDRKVEERCEDLSDHEDAMLEQGGSDVIAYEDDLFQLNQHITDELASLDAEISELRRARAAWNEDASFRFACIKKQFHGQGRDLLMDRFELEFPHLTREQILAHESALDSLRFALQRHAATFRQWRRDRAQLLRRYQLRLVEKQRSEELVAERRQEMLLQREKQKKLHGRLEAERARASVRGEERRAVSRERMSREQAVAAAREETRHKRAQSLKDLLRQNNERAREQKMRMEVEEAERRRMAEREQSDRARQNAERVQLRRQMDDLKHREQAEQRRAAERERNEREHRLQRAMDMLKVEAPRDRERLLRIPARAQAQAYHDPAQCVQLPGRGPHEGFYENRLMNDARYKLSAALQAAGLFNTRAGHEALAAVGAPRPAQPHIVSNVFRGDGYP